ncbi:MAG TPA: ester cyclase [Edaphobacter sp.]|nr:ester cyclase [Edaphobacter sp.]
MLLRFISLHSLAAIFFVVAPSTSHLNPASGGSMQTNAQATAIHRFYEECLNQNHLDVLPELVTPNVINHSSTGDQTGVAALEQTIHHVRTLFPEPHFTVDDVISDGNKAAARWTLVAAHTAPIAGVAPTGKQLTEQAVVFYRFENGKIAEIWAQMDQLGILRQVGVVIPGMPAPQRSNDH